MTEESIWERLSEKQRSEMNEWKESLKKEFGESGTFSYRVSHIEIGMCIYATSSLTEEERDITDVDSW